MKKRVFSLLVVLLFSFAFSLPLHAAAYDSELLSEAVSVYNAELDVFVFDKNATKVISPAPAKLMTALIAAEYFAGRMHATTTVTSAALKNLEGSAVLNLKAGEVIAVEHLLHAVLIAGMSDAANALAIEIAGSISSFVKLMNEKAETLGAENTIFSSANGLEQSGSVTTAEDTARIAAAVYQNAALRAILAKRYYVVPATNIHESVTIYTRNMLTSPQSEYYNKSVLGISAGFSDSYGYAVMAAAESNFPYICVSYGEAKTDGGKIAAYLETSALLAWAKQNFAELKLLDAARIIAEIPISGGRDTGHVLIVPKNAVYAYLDVDTDLSKITLSPSYEEKLKAPVEKGTAVGEVTILLDGKPIAQTELVTKNAVKKSGSPAENSLGKIFLFLMILLALAYITIIRKRTSAATDHKSNENRKY